MSRGVTFRDLILGVEFPLVEGFIPGTGDIRYVSAVLVGSLTTGYGVSPVLGPDYFIRDTVKYAMKISSVMGGRAVPRYHSEGDSLLVTIESPLGTIRARAWRSGGLTRYYTAGPRDDEEWLARMAERARPFRRPAGTTRTIMDPMRGVPALDVDLMPGCGMNYQYLPRGLQLDVRCRNGEVHIETWNGIAGPPIVAQAAASKGVIYGNPPRIESLVPGGDWQHRISLGAPMIAAQHKGELFAYKMQGMGGSDVGLLLFREGAAVWVWLVAAQTVYPMIGPIVSWTAGRAFARGELAGSLLLTIVSHIRVREELSKAIMRESQAEYRSAIRRIREMGRMSRSIARSIRSSSTPLINPARPYYSTSDYSSDSSWDSSYSPGDEWLKDDVEERWGDTWGGQADYYLDQDGMIRNYDSGEEVVGELGDEGYIYDSEGREIGYIEDGYIYDAETGEQVGIFHPEASDEYQMELAEQRTGDPTMTYGLEDDIFAPDRVEINPFHASKEEDED